MGNGFAALAKEYAPLIAEAKKRLSVQENLYKESGLYREYCARTADFIERFLKKHEWNLDFSRALDLHRHLGTSAQFLTAWDKKHHWKKPQWEESYEKAEAGHEKNIMYAKSLIDWIHKAYEYDLPPLCHLRKIPRWEDFAAANQGAQNA